MPHVVLVVNRLASLLNTSLGASKRLRAAGFETTFICPENLAERIAAEGERVVVLHHDERFAARVVADPMPSLTNPLALVPWVRGRRQLRAESLASDELVEAISSLTPDLLLINAETHTAMIATDPLRIPRLATTNFFSVFRSSDLPPLSMTLPVPTNPLQRVKISAAWWRVRAAAVIGRGQRRFSRAGLAAMVLPIRSDTVDLFDLKPLAKACNVDLRSRTDRSQWLRPHIYKDVPLISFTAQEMDLPHRANEQLSYVGPMISEGRVEQELSGEARTRWQVMLDQRSTGSGSHPIVYCSLGTVWSTDYEFLKRVLDVFRRRPNWNLVLSLGGAKSGLSPGDESDSQLGPIPANVLTLDWAPQLEILANADCFITHGGVKSLSEAVHFEVPVVTYSTGFVDQNGNARRVQHHRLGIMGSKDDDTVEDIEADIARAMSDPEIAAAVTRMRANFVSYEATAPGHDYGVLVQVVKRFIEHSSGEDGP